MAERKGQMKSIYLGPLLVTVLLLPGSAAAQQAPASKVPPLAEPSARARIESRGFRDIGVLSEVSPGVWSGTATRAGKSYGLTVDHRGYVVAQ
jgi:hypothetical protein